MFLTKHSNGTYYIIYDKPDGRRGMKSTKEKIKSKALKKLQQFNVNVENTSSTLPSMLLKEFQDYFLKRSKPYYKIKTYKVYQTTFKYALTYFNDVLLNDLTTRKIEEYLLSRIQETSIFAARKDLSNLSCAFNKAVRDGYLLKNPCKGIKRFRLPEKQPLFYTKEDFQKLIEAIDDEDIRDLVNVAANTGMRQGEQLNLRWSQINFQRGMITLDNRNHLTKTNRIRTIPINRVVQNIIEKRLKQRSMEHDLVFTMNDNPIEQQFFTRYFKRYVIKANLNPKLNYHALRHSFASWLIQGGVSIYVISKLLGHRDLKVTEIYSHLSVDNFKNAVDVLSPDK